MLILTRKPGESLYIGDNVKIVVVEVKGSQVRLGIEADRSLPIYREEIYLQILEENRNAAAASKEDTAGLEGLSQAWKDRKDGPPAGDKPSSKGLTLGSANLGPVQTRKAGTPNKLVATSLSGSGKVNSGELKSSPEVFTKKVKKKGPEGEQ
jgi:carbon storage regulator